MVLTKELNKMLKFINSYPGVSLEDLRFFGSNCERNIAYLTEKGLIESNNNAQKSFRLTIEGEIYIESQTKKTYSLVVGYVFKFLELISVVIVPFLVVLIS